tara:strand:- start:963 stop:1169 length:207 start_codon:yes stop_codon:yes gene_type:complete
MFLNFLIIFFSILLTVSLFELVTIVVIAVNYDIENVTPQSKALARKDALTVIVGGVVAYCLVVLGFLL